MVEIDREERVLQGNAIARFLNDETVKRALAGLRLQWFEEWTGAESPQKAEEIRAKARAFDDLYKHLSIIVESGERAALEIERLKRPQVQI